MDACHAPDERMSEADGEAVWAWYPDADIKLATMFAHCADDGDNKARSPGRARRKPLKPLRREGRATGEPVVTTLVCSFYFACEAHRAPGFPCALHLGV